MIVAIAGGKGGVGKTTVSLNLGRELDAVVVDADLTTPDLPRGRGPDLHDVLADRAGALEAVKTINNVHLLPCGRTLAGARAADVKKLNKTVELLDRQFDYVLIDCPAGLARDVGYQLASADAAVLVTMAKTPALWNALQTRELAGKLDTPIASFVVNRASGPQADDVAERLEEKYSTDAEVVRKRKELRETQDEGVALRDAYPDCPARKSIVRVARHIRRCKPHVTV